MEKAKKILITGATGLIGKLLSDKLNESGYEIHIISRNKAESLEKLPFVTKIISLDEIYSDNNLFDSEDNKYFAVINLAGASIAGKKWSENYKKIVMESRTKITSKLSDLIINSKYPPEMFISMSAIGYYGNSGDKLISETEPAGDDFLAEVCKNWESQALKAEKYTKVIIFRTGMVLSKIGGALEKMSMPFKFFIGGTLGSGKQWVSWIHIEDLINMFAFALENKTEGIFNAVSPNPVIMNEFVKVLGRVLRRPSIFRVPELILKLMLGESAQIVLFSQRVNSKKIKDQGYEFKYSDLRDALEHIINN
jgi:uncharacterized protein